MLVTLLPTILGVIASGTWAGLALARGFFWRVSGDNGEKLFTAEFAEEARRAQGGAEPSPRRI